MRGAFYYPWYPSHWQEAAGRTPILGQYDSIDVKLSRIHATQMAWGGVEIAICSWWGRGTESDIGTQAFLYSGKGIVKTVFHYELEIDQDFSSNLDYLKNISRQSGYFLYGSRPVLFIYRSWDPAVAAVATEIASAKGWYVITQATGGHSQYSYTVPSSHFAVVSGKSISCSPGFWRAGEASPVVVRDMAAFRNALLWAEATRAAGWPWQLLISWNEIMEGSQIEPMIGEDGEALRVLHEVWGNY